MVQVIQLLYCLYNQSHNQSYYPMNLVVRIVNYAAKKNKLADVFKNNIHNFLNRIEKNKLRIKK